MIAAYPVLGVQGGVSGERGTSRGSVNGGFGQPCARVPREPKPRLFTETLREIALGNPLNYRSHSGLPTCSVGWEGSGLWLGRVLQVIVHPYLMRLFRIVNTRVAAKNTPAYREFFQRLFSRNISPPFVAIALTGTSKRGRLAFRRVAGNQQTAIIKRKEPYGLFAQDSWLAVLAGRIH